MKTKTFFAIICLGFSLGMLSCTDSPSTSPAMPLPAFPEFIRAVDISRYPEIASTSPTFLDSNGQEGAFLDILKENGVNTIRLRLWVDPKQGHSTLEEVKAFAKELKTKGFAIWLCLHYSDTWADPGQQEKPAAWKDLGFSALKGRVYSYTERVMKEVAPQYIQIGNEINSGLLHPEGHLINQPEQFRELLSEGILAVRNQSETCRIMLHFAGLSGADGFFEQVKELDYDMIALSYYPIWHGKDLRAVSNIVNQLGGKYGKEVLIAETAYPFTLGWNDWTNNIVGLDEQLILPDFPASPSGQKDFIGNIRQIMANSNYGIGLCYWGGELIAWKGSESTTASPWENQALFDFNHQALPVLKEFQAM